MAINLSTLNGINGFRLDGVADRSGRAVSSAGDVNGDGFDDLIIGSYAAGPLEVYSHQELYFNGIGWSYVVFGNGDAFAPAIDLSTLNGSNGFRLDGVDIRGYSGWSVSSAGDFNGDGIDDLIVGARNANPDGNTWAGSSFVVFGNSTGFAPIFSLSTLTGSNGFRLDGVTADDRSGYSVSSAGDFNGDGIDDLIVGAIGADPGGNSAAGSSYVVFGTGDAFAPTFELSALNGSNGFRLDGVNFGDKSGKSVSSAGDVNGDGIDDVIIGAPGVDQGGNSIGGSSYVVFGKGGAFAPSLELSALNGSNGFRLDGLAQSGRSGWSVSSAGDVNGDGVDDLIIGAPGAVSGYVVFGTNAGFASTIALGSLDESNGFRINYIGGNGDFTGGSVSSAGDVNGDGFDDLIIGASGASPSGVYQAGSSYLVFGGQGVGGGGRFELGSLQFDGSLGTVLEGVVHQAFSGGSVSSAGDVNGDGYDDLIIGSPSISDAGSSYVIFGGVGFAETFTSTAGSETINGGAGVDTVSYETAITDIRADLSYYGQNQGEATGDTFIDIENLRGSSDKDVLLGDGTNNGLDGLDGNDRLFGRGGSDVLNGGLGRDWLDGGAGIDTASYENATGGIRADLSFYGQNLGEARGDTFVDLENLTGSSNNDVLLGNNAANRLEGLDGNDRLFGRGGSDTLIGGIGADRLGGGFGVGTASDGAADFFVYTNIAESTVGGLGRDTIIDFWSGDGDQIDLSAIDANANTVGIDDAFAFIGNAGFSSVAGQLRYDAPLNLVQGDVDGDGAADFAIKIDDVANMFDSDFIL